MGEKLDFNHINHRIIGAISNLLCIIRYHMTISDSLVRLKIATAGKRVGILAFVWGEHLFFVRLFIPPTAIFSQIFLMGKYGCSPHQYGDSHLLATLDCFKSNQVVPSGHHGLTNGTENYPVLQADWWNKKSLKK